MIIVTGGAGFIGSNIVKALNERGENNIVVVDELSDGHKFVNLADCQIADYLDKDDFLHRIKSGGEFEQVRAIFHEGACSTTTEWDGKYMMQVNYEYSKVLLHHCLEFGIPFLYASSAAVYGGSDIFKESPEYEKPLNVYGYSKFLFDQYVRKLFAANQIHSQVAGFRYFNVYGPREQHKGSMASVAFHLNHQIKENGICKLFAGHDGYGDGMQRRDFIYVHDLCQVKLWFMDNLDKSGIFNLGTGRSQTFNDVAHAVIKYHGQGKVQYIPFPDHLKGAYQSFTEADISALRAAGYQAPFASVEEGVMQYLASINAK